MTEKRNDYAKPSITRNGNIREITFNHIGWTCSLDDSSSDDDSGKKHGRGED